MDLYKAALLLGALMCAVNGVDVDGYIKTEGAWILSQKGRFIVNTAAECAAKCDSEITFTCRSFMYVENDQECWTSAANSTEETVLYRNGTVLYEKYEDCVECIGENYRGKVSTTENGYTCQHWDSQWPHKHDFNPSVHPDKNLEENYCRNPDSTPWPWCYTTNPNKRWELCSIPRCSTEPPAIIPELTCVTGKGEAYRGTTAVTVSGKTCQRWSIQTPHQHNRTPEIYNCKGLESNYCRNPDNSDKPWCYTTDRNTRWEYCNVSNCGPRPENCVECIGENYRGKVSTTENGYTCQRWNSQTPHKHDFKPSVHPDKNLEENYCRNPDSTPWPWCYTTNPNKRWELCSIPRCSTEPPAIIPELTCVTGKGEAYRGTTAVTVSGKTCQRWSIQTPHQHDRTPEIYNCKGLESNYCRNPDNSDKPWCYTTDRNTRWEYCNVPSCGPRPENCTECIGENYRGQVSTTENGYTCQRWDSQTPHKHDFKPSTHPDKNLVENYCRNPNSSPQPWCYTTHPNKKWDYCSIPRCSTKPPPIPPELTCATGKGQAYRGPISLTKSGKECQRWSTQTPHQHDRTPDMYQCKGLVRNYCRNPDNSDKPWCYTTDNETRWEYCDIPVCGKEQEDCIECTGENYRGQVTTTENGYTCQHWDSQTPNKHKYTPEKYPCKGLKKNYCRNPDGQSKPWCYTTDPGTSWDYCNIPSC